MLGNIKDYNIPNARIVRPWAPPVYRARAIETTLVNE